MDFESVPFASFHYKKVGHMAKAFPFVKEIKKSKRD